MPIKRLIDPMRVRKALPHGFGWIDHRLLRDGYISHCSPQALALYVLLVCASDAQGLSYYSAPRIGQLLSLEPAALSEARRELIGLGLIAYQKPLYQLLSLEGEVLEHKSQPVCAAIACSLPLPLMWLIGLAPPNPVVNSPGRSSITKAQEFC